MEDFTCVTSNWYRLSDFCRHLESNVSNSCRQSGRGKKEESMSGRDTHVVVIALILYDSTVDGKQLVCRRRRLYFMSYYRLSDLHACQISARYWYFTNIQSWTDVTYLIVSPLIPTLNDFPFVIFPSWIYWMRLLSGYDPRLVLSPFLTKSTFCCNFETGTGSRQFQRRVNSRYYLGRWSDLWHDL